MDISKIDVNQNEFTSAELDAMCDICVKAKEIADNEAVNKLVQQHMQDRATKIKSTADLRKKAQSKALEE